MNADAEYASDNADWGRTVETAACNRWNLEAIASDPNEPWWYDARVVARIDDLEGEFGAVPAGTPVETKAARYRIQNDGLRRGRWWIAESSHEQLLEADGEYALAVYAPGEGVLAMAMRPAWFVDDLVTSWTRCGSGHYAQRSTQIPWNRAFDEKDVATDSISNKGGSA